MFDNLKTEICNKTSYDISTIDGCNKIIELLNKNNNEEKVNISDLLMLCSKHNYPYKVSPKTLNCLSKYLGYTSWKNFKLSQFNVSEELKTEWMYLGECSFKFNKKYKSNELNDVIEIIERPEIEKNLKEFIDSNKFLYNISAPGGYGKTIFLKNWFEKNEFYDSNIVLNINSESLKEFTNVEYSFEEFVERALCVPKKFLSYILNRISETNLKFIIVIDGIANATLNSFKQKIVFQKISKFLIKFSKNTSLKVIVSSRNLEWVKNTKLLSKEFDIDNSMQYNSVKSNGDYCLINFSKFNYNELQDFINRNINLKYNTNIQISDLDNNVAELLLIPEYTKAFLNVFSIDKKYILFSKIEIIEEYLNKVIFNSRYSNEKNQLLEVIIRLSDVNNIEIYCNKRDLISAFDIEVNQFGNHYNAYKDLMNYGIIKELSFFNSAGIIDTYIKISNDYILAYYLSNSLNISEDISENINLAYDKLIENPIRNYVISLMLEKAFIRGEYKFLNKVNYNILKERSNSIVISKYFIDLNRRNNLNDLTNFADIYFKYFDISNLLISLKNINIDLSDSTDVLDYKIKAYSSALIHSIVSLDIKECNINYQKIIEHEPTTQCSSTAISIRLFSILMYNYFINNSDVEKYLQLIFYYREMAYEASNFPVIDGEFEIIVSNALYYIGDYVRMELLADDAQKNYVKYRNNILTENFKLVQMYLTVAQSKLKQKNLFNNLRQLELENMNISPSFSDFSKITYYVSLAEGAFDNGDFGLTEKYIDKAFHITESNDYELFTVYLLNKLASFYNKMGEKVKEKICIDERDFIIKKNNYKKFEELNLAV